jgi:hypothetical protein
MLTLSQFFRSCLTLPGNIQSHKSKKDYLREFRQVFSSQEAKNASNVVYVFVCEKKIPRVKSESSVVYIGKTKQTLKQRWLRYAKVFTSDFNLAFFSYILEHYGEIRIAYLPLDTKEAIKQAETDLLKDYYKQYNEFPPHNAQRK